MNAFIGKLARTTKKMEVAYGILESEDVKMASEAVILFELSPWPTKAHDNGHTYIEFINRLEINKEIRSRWND